jgi:hypothetical protein
MTYEIITPFTVKTKQGDLTLNPGQTITLAEEKAVKLIGEGKIKPIGEPKHDTLNNLLSYFDEKGKIKNEFESESLNERMCLAGENTEPEQTKPYVTSFGVLVIPFNSDKKYHYWKGGQGVCDTLREIGRCDLIEKYKSLYCN